jgi:polar amino acid transport system substrate-binding protein
LILISIGCNRQSEEEPPDIRSLKELEGGKIFAVPTGTVADQSVLKKFPDAQVTYYNSVYDCALAVRNNKADAAVYDKPVLKNIAAKNEGIVVLDELMFPDDYGFAVKMDDAALKEGIDATLAEIKSNGIYDEMVRRWLPVRGTPGPMPDLMDEEAEEELLFGTAAVSEPMSFIDSSQEIVGFDIEFAHRIAKRLGKRLEVVNMEFGAMLPALISGKVDMIGAGLSITEERAKSVLFSNPYYESGIVALVRGDADGAGENAANAGKATPEPGTYAEIGVLMGSIHETYANKTYQNTNIQSFNTVTDLLMALNGGKVDGVFVDHTSVREILSQNDAFAVLEANLFVVDIAAGFHQKSDALREQFNEFLKQIRNDGTYAAMEKRWMTDTGSTMPQIMAPNPKGVLKVGVVSDIGIPFTAKSNEQWLGFDIELSSRFAAWLGREVEWVDMPFGSLLPSLISGKIDMIAASVMITEERSKQIDFSDPYYASGVSILGRKSNETSSLSGQNSEGDAVSPTFWKKLSDSFYNNLILEKRYMMIVRGLYVTILISLLAALFGTLLGGLVCAMRMSKNSVVKAIAIFYISLIRGTPVLVLLMIIYYVIFSSININPVIVAMIAFGINFAAYVSEMFRTSIESIDKGQHEAGIAGGFTKAQTFLHIMMPQAIRRVLPVYKGEFISLVKMTSVVGYIAVEDLTKASDIIRSRTFDAFFPLLMAAVIYILLSWLLTIGLNRIEINLDPRKRIRRIHIRKEIVQ